jgi:transcription elongation factor Elf1
MIQDVKIENVLLLYECPECGEEADQWLKDIVQNGTLSCDCGLDMQLKPECQIRT